nr:hypothetical protein [Sinorhizobium sp. RAC02]
MDFLPPHDERTWQPVEPHAVRHRPDPLRHPRHRFPFLPLRHQPDFRRCGRKRRRARNVSNGTIWCRF